MNKKDILDKIKSLDNLSNEERAYLVNLVNTKKKYGLVWEDKPEDVEELLRTKLPILKEVKERAIINDTETEKHPNHILIEGDNLHALTALNFTHFGKVKLVYFDPPYNTGNKSWRYNNDYVEKDDNYKHSKFISFLEKRIKLAKDLLKDDGIIVCAIDDYEVHNVRHLLDEIFTEENRLGTLVVVHNPGGRQDDRFFPTAHEYMLVYAKNKELAKVGLLDLDDNKLAQYNKTDKYGRYKLRGFRRSGANSRRSDRPKLWYPIYLNPQSLELSTIQLDGFTEEMLPIDDKGIERVWRWNESTFNSKKEKYIEVRKIKGKFNLQVKERENDNEGEKAKTIWHSPKYSAVNGTSRIKDIFSDTNEKVFDFPKSPYLMEDVLRIADVSGEDKIVDFFAGSGTTLDAILNYNKKHSTKLCGALITNNENNIAEEVTYERNKRLIQGYTNSKGELVEGLRTNNLRYYQCDFINREPSIANKRQLTQLATELLCIKEDCYQEVSSHLNTKNWNKLFTNGSGLFVYVVYDDLYIEEAVEALTQFVQKEIPESKIKVYVFANGQYAYAEEFEDIAENITLAALPDAIYKAYQNILPKENKEFVPVLEEDVDVEPEMDFE